jgi:hypothetical protein
MSALHAAEAARKRSSVREKESRKKEKARRWPG